MQLEVIKEGSSGPLVLAWEQFLRDEMCYLVEADGFFDAATAEATKAFQQNNNLEADGKVGPKTWGTALQKGFHVVVDPNTDKTSANWPPKPSFGPTDYRTREQTFGHIEFKPSPTAGNPEGVIITNGWAAQHIVEVEVPQLRMIPGIKVGDSLQGAGPKTGLVQLHEKVAKPMIDLWSRWEEAGLLHLVLTWAGMWSPRFVRGSRSTLSNHAYASAFDINAPWNGLQKTPALVGQKGSVRELVPHANELGWYWLGHNDKRPDGMHFEFSRSS
jgi:putative peptidoglycan binding protein/D-alanyl-D-alanine carboxypeptidase-like protein